MRRPTPNILYRRLRSQLGSIRDVYLAPRDIETFHDFSGGREVVLLVHGFFQTRNIWDAMERRLRHDGYAVMSFNQHGSFSRLNTQPIDALARVLAQKIEHLSQTHGFEKIHIVGHSKGGIVGRRYVQHFGGARRVQSLTTLGTPHYGTPIAIAGLALFMLSKNPRELLPSSRILKAMNKDPFPSTIPLTSIYSKSDLLCPHWSSHLRPRVGESSMKNICVPGIGHSELTWDPTVYQHVRMQLRHAEAAKRG